MLILNVSGNITANAIVKTIGSNTVTSFTVASNERYKKTNGDIVENVTFIRCNLWNNPNAAALLYKGRSINAMGSFKTRTAVNRTGEMEIYLEIRVTFFQVFGKNEAKKPEIETHKATPPILTPDEVQEVENDLPF